MEVLKKGTIEPLLVGLRDRLQNITSLAQVTSLRFDTKKKSDASAIQTDVAATFDGDVPMTAICLIDTTLSGYVAGEQYGLYLKYQAGVDSPILGPVYFRVEAD